MATPSLTLPGASNALKFRFSPDNLKLAGYKRHPFLGWVPKRSTWTGDSKLHQIYHSGGRGKGTTIVQAQANQSAARIARFTVTRQKLFSVASIGREFLLASKDEAGSMLKGKMALMDERLYELYRDVSHNLYGDASGSYGTIGAVTLNNPAAGTDRITLSNPEDVVNFEVGQFLGAAATPTGAVRDDDYFQVTAVDRSNGYVFVLGDTEVGSAWAANDHLLERGDAADGGATVKIHGLQAWVPATAPSSGESYLGVDRSVDVTRLAGHRYDGSATGQPPLEALQDAGTVMSREGASPEVAFVNPKQRARMVRQLQGATVYNDVDSTFAQVYYKGLEVETGAGNVLVISDPDCPVNKGFMLSKSALHLDALGEVPHLVDDDGLVLLRGATTDDFEVRFAMYADLIVDEPREICNITFTA